jgi:L-ascorbate metabolism protein UlaG (beta-lactamase superfamily)
VGILIIIILIIVAAVYLFMQQAKFGRQPTGERFQRIRRSVNYKNGQFQNLSNTPALSEGVSYFEVIREFFFTKKKRKIPSSLLPSQKTDLRNLDPHENVLVWFGHSSYFMQIDGKTILVDPVLSGNASPVNFTTRSFKGSDVFTAAEMPEADYLFITHDHWDHLDYETIMTLKPGLKKIVTGLGVGEHLERWGIDKNIIIEKDWNEEIILDEGFKVITAPARHFSGRTFKRNGSLWMSFILKTPSMKIYIGGDSGYGDHFALIGKQHGPFDLAILENGQYDKSWKYIHMMPEQVVQAAKDLDAKLLLPVHWSKFSLANHEWDEPIIRVVKEAKVKNMPVLHPAIGEKINLNGVTKAAAWWEAIKD